MELVTKEELNSYDAGCNEFPYEILERFRPNALLETSREYAQLVADHPGYELRMVRDDVAKILKVYWRRVS